jgi:hypothetical protein
VSLCVGQLVLIALCLLGEAAPAEPSREAIAQAVQQLGSQRFAVREKASTFLRAAGRAAEPALREAAKSDDLEVGRRAQAILDEFKWGLYPDTPPALIELIQRYRAGDDKERLRALGELFAQGKAGCAVLKKLATAEDDPDQRQAIQNFIADYLGRTLPLKLAAGDPGPIEDLLDVALVAGLPEGPRHYAAFVAWRGRLDAKLAEFQARERDGDATAAEVLATLYRMKGDLARARAAAEKAGKADLIETILLEQGDWNALLQRPAAADGQDAAWALGVRAAYLRRAGQVEEFEKAVSELRKFRGAEAWSAASALFFNDRPNEAIELLAQSADPIAAFELLALQWKFREALALAEKARADGSPHRFGLEVLEARTRWRLGEKERAREIFVRLGDLGLKERSSAPYANLVQTEYRLGLKDLAFDHCGRLLARWRSDRPREVLDLVFPKQGTTAEAWWKYLNKPSGVPAADALPRLRKLLEGKLPAAEFEALVKQAEQAARKLQGGEYAQWLHTLAETCRLTGREDLLRYYLEKRVEVAASADAHLRLGNFLAGRADWNAAAEQYRLSWEKDRQKAVPLYLRGWALARAGREAEGRPLTELAHWLPLGNEDARYQLADTLQEHDLRDESRRELELLARLGTLDTEQLPNALGRLSDAALARKDYAQAAAYMERVVLLCLRTHRRFVKNEGYLLGPLLVHHYRLRALVAAGRPAETGPELRHCLGVLPADDNLPIALVPELANRGRRQEADELFAAAFAVHAKACADYPKSALAHNALAWLAARCRRNLDEALEHAKKAVALAPEEPGYADTLAEVYFQRGAKQDAIAWIKKSMELDPKREYFRKQLKRFEAGDPSAEVVE